MSTKKSIFDNIDCNLKFKDHVINLGKKLSTGCYAVRVILNELGYFMFAKSAYFELTESHLRYGISFCSVCSNYLIHKYPKVNLK